MALDQLESNSYPDIGNHLNNVFSSDLVSLDFSIQARQEESTWSSKTHTYRSDIILHLKFYIKQEAILTNRDIFSELENSIGTLICATDGYVLSREVVPFQNSQSMEVSYLINMKDFKSFEMGLAKFALDKASKDFTLALEKKLDEDEVSAN